MLGPEPLHLVLAAIGGRDRVVDEPAHVDTLEAGGRRAGESTTRSKNVPNDPADLREVRMLEQGLGHARPFDAGPEIVAVVSRASRWRDAVSDRSVSDDATRARLASAP